MIVWIISSKIIHENQAFEALKNILHRFFKKLPIRFLILLLKMFLSWRLKILKTTLASRHSTKISITQVILKILYENFYILRFFNQLTTVPGVSTGLAYNQIGGSSLVVESSLSSMRTGKSSVSYSGNLKEIMKESMEISYSFARLFLNSIENNFLEK